MRSRLIPIIGFAVVGGAVLAGLISIAIGEEGPNEFEVAGVAQAQRLFGGIEQTGDEVGASTAPVTVSVFNDLQCRECADYHRQVVPPLVEEYVRPGDVRLSLRHFSQSRKPTQISGVAATAAGEQGSQWQYANIFLANLDQIPDAGVTDEFLTTIAAAVPSPEFDVAQWERDLGSERTESRVLADAELATELRLPAQPAVVVDGPGGARELLQKPTLEQIEAAIAEVAEPPR